VASIATKENEKDLIEKVRKMSKGALELFVREAKDARDSRGEEFSNRQNMVLLKINDNEFPPGRELTRERMSFSVDENIALEMRKIKLRMEKERKEAVEWNDVMREMVKAMNGKRKKRRKKTEKNVSNMKVTRNISVAKKDNLDKKYHGKCGVKGCNKPATEIHHIDGFAQVRNHDNLIPLCHEHHELKHYEMPGSPWRAREFVGVG
jgi:hypothetical protein